MNVIIQHGFRHCESCAVYGAKQSIKLSGLLRKLRSQ